MCALGDGHTHTRSFVLRCFGLHELRQIKADRGHQVALIRVRLHPHAALKIGARLITNAKPARSTSGHPARAFSGGVFRRCGGGSGRRSPPPGARGGAGTPQCMATAVARACITFSCRDYLFPKVFSSMTPRSKKWSEESLCC